jgi:RNA polymerase sigma-70 factor (ECF subfamily)
MASDPTADEVSDDDLLAQVAGGAVEAFATLFRRRRAVVYRLALHMTGSASMADDVTQDVFMAVMRDAGRYEAGRSGATAWLCGIARNHARRRLEADRRIVSFDDSDAGQAVPALTDHPLEDLTRAQGIEALRRAILTLPLPYREAIVLCDLQELSYAAAADAIGCAVGTVRSRLHRGRALLASKLAAAPRRIRRRPDGGAPTRSFSLRAEVGAPSRSFRLQAEAAGGAEKIRGQS